MEQKGDEPAVVGAISGDLRRGQAAVDLGKLDPSPSGTASAMLLSALDGAVAAEGDEGEAATAGSDDDGEDRPPATTKAAGRSRTAKAKGTAPTPLEKQVIDLKRQHPGTLLMVETGYKYRLFGADATLAARLLGVVAFLSRDRFMTCSIPTFRLAFHVRRLVEAGLRVGVVRQTETAAIKQRGASKSKVFARRLVATFSRGTLPPAKDDEAITGAGAPSAATQGSAAAPPSANGPLDDGAPEPVQDTFRPRITLALCEDRSWTGPPGSVRIGMCALDIGTGEALYDEFTDRPGRPALQSRLLHLLPVEVVLPRCACLAKVSDRPDGAGDGRPDASQGRSQAGDRPEGTRGSADRSEVGGPTLSRGTLSALANWSGTARSRLDVLSGHRAAVTPVEAASGAGSDAAAAAAVEWALGTAAERLFLSRQRDAQASANSEPPAASSRALHETLGPAFSQLLLRSGSAIQSAIGEGDNSWGPARRGILGGSMAEAGGFQPQDRSPRQGNSKPATTDAPSGAAGACSVDGAGGGVDLGRFAASPPAAAAVACSDDLGAVADAATPAALAGGLGCGVETLRNASVAAGVKPLLTFASEHLFEDAAARPSLQRELAGAARRLQPELSDADVTSSVRTGVVDRLPGGCTRALGGLLLHLRTTSPQRPADSVLKGIAAALCSQPRQPGPSAPSSASLAVPVAEEAFCLGPLRPWRPDASMKLPALTLLDLDITSARGVVGSSGSLLWLLNHCSTPFGFRSLQRWVRQPLLDPIKIRDRQDCVAALATHAESQHTRALLGPLLKALSSGLPDLERALGKLVAGRSTPAEAIALLRCFRTLANSLPTPTAATAASLPLGLRRLLAAMPDVGPLVASRLAELNVPQLDRTASKSRRGGAAWGRFRRGGGAGVAARAAAGKQAKAEAAASALEVFTPDAEASRFPALVESRAAVERVRTELQGQLPAIRELLGNPKQEFRSLRTGVAASVEYLVEVRKTSSAAQRVPASWMAVSTTKDFVRYHTPEVVKLMSDLQFAKETLALAAQDAWKSWVASETPALRQPLGRVVECLGELDALQSLAVVASRPGYTRPTVLGPPHPSGVWARAARHPMVEAVMAATKRSTPTGAAGARQNTRVANAASATSAGVSLEMHAALAAAGATASPHRAEAPPDADGTGPALIAGGSLGHSGGRRAGQPTAGILAGGAYVPNDIAVGERQAVADDAELATQRRGSLRTTVVTGPNMGGKSSFVRSSALLAVMAQIGSFVPAAEALVGVVDGIYTRMGATDDLEAGHSTFMVEMRETAAILDKATQRSLVILDELGRGTATADGTAVALATLRHLVLRLKCPSFLVTHYPDVAQAAARFGCSAAGAAADVVAETEAAPAACGAAAAGQGLFAPTASSRGHVGNVHLSYLVGDDDDDDDDDDEEVDEEVGKDQAGRGAPQEAVAAPAGGPRLTFLYRAARGAADGSYGLNVARLAGLPQSVLVSAQEMRSRLQAPRSTAAKRSRTEVGAEG